MRKTLQFMRDWALVFSMLIGIFGYLLYAAIPQLEPTHAAAYRTVTLMQPALIFVMLFLAFCKVDPHRLRLRRWHLWLLLIQGGCFSMLSVVLIMMPHSALRVVLEGAMICMICPTATASPVITHKLGGDIHGIVTYIILINIAASVLIPLFMPYVHPNPAIGVASASLLILAKVFPLLLFPLFCALALRKWRRRLYDRVGQWSEASFYLWVVSLSLALAVTTSSVCHSTVAAGTEIWLGVVSLICCVAQFGAGRAIGARYSDKVTAGQALGQKNTVLAIWMGYTFFTPITSLVGGFYSIWHNVINSYQLYRHKSTKHRVDEKTRTARTES